MGQRFGVVRSSRRAHNPETGSSNLPGATKFDVGRDDCRRHSHQGRCVKPMLYHLTSRVDHIGNIETEIFTMPREGTMNGKLVIDGSWDSTLLEESITLTVKDGFVVEVKGGEMAERIKETYEIAAEKLRPKDKQSVWTVAEFGFGMNQKARLIGNVLEDEKVRGTCYFAIGDNSALGGTSHSGIHVTGVLVEPTIHLDELVVISAGEVES